MYKNINEIKFDGKGLPLFKLYVSTLLLTILTLGVYYFWAKVKIKKYFYNHTTFLNGRFEYHVTGKEKLVGFLKGMVIIGIPFFLIVYGLPRLLVLTGVDGNLVSAFAPLIFYVCLLFIVPAIIYGSRKFQLARTSWNSVHFKFNGKVKDIYKIIFKGVFLSIFTLGIYSFWLRINLKKYLIGNSAIGNQKFSFDGKGKDLMLISLPAIILIPLTLGIYLFWLQAKLERYYWSHTKFHENAFQTNMTGFHYFKISIGAILLSVFTLGFGIPWAVVMVKKYILQSIFLEGEVDLTSIQSDIDATADALTEGISEAGDFLEAFGDFFA